MTTFTVGPFTITKRTSDFHACITGETAAWGCGQSTAEAIGDVVMSNIHRFVFLNGPYAAEKKAYAEGKTIQWRFWAGNHEWGECSPENPPEWSGLCQYRVKPEEPGTNTKEPSTL